MMTSVRRLLIVALTALAVQSQAAAWEDHFAEARTHFVPDPKTTLLSAEPCDGGTCIKTTSPEAAAFLQAAAHDGVTVTLLPDASVGSASVGLIRVPVAAIHRKNAFSSEIVTEAVMGTPVKLLGKDGWWRIQTPEGYLGWVHSLQVTPLTETAYAEYLTHRRYVVSLLDGTVYTRPDTRSLIVTELPNGTIVTRTPTQPRNGYAEVHLPDGRTGWLETRYLKDFDHAQSLTEHLFANPQELREKIADNACRFLGRTYRWAGTSPWGMDCSGLIKVAWLMTGLEGPRDTDEMARLADRLPDDTKTFRKGDLLFFGTDGISHVAMSLGGTRFIHSLGDVHLGDLNPEDKFYDAANAERFLFAVRPAFGKNCLTLLKNVPLYNGSAAEPLACPNPKP